MGTAVGIDVRDRDVLDSAVDEAFGRLRAIDARFSTFRRDSEVSRYGRGEVADDDLSDELREVLGLCETIRVQSDGVFDIRRHRAEGIVDPSGLVKGWAVEEAVAILLRAGGRNFAVNAGGDIVVRGGPVPGGHGGSASSTRRSDRRSRPSSRFATWRSRRRAHTNGARRDQPAHRRSADGSPQRDGCRSEPHRCRRLRDGCIRDGHRGHRLGRRAPRLRGLRHHDRPPVDLDGRLRGAPRPHRDGRSEGARAGEGARASEGQVVDLTFLDPDRMAH